MKKLVSMLLVLVLTVSLITGCSSSAPTAEQPKPEQPKSTETPSVPAEENKYGGTIIVGYPNEPDTLNVYSTHLLGDVQACVVEGLLVPDSDMKYVPVLAKETPTLENGLIKMTDDGKMNITYNLKEGVLWHDGEKFTSADVLYTWEALKDESFIAESKEGVFDIEKIETPDEYTVIVYYKEQLADFAVQLFTFGILPKHVCEGTDLNEQTGYNRAPIGTGPFKFKDWKAGEYIELVKNENYHVQGEPYLDGVVFKFINDQNTQMAQLKTGEINYVAGMPYDKMEELKNIPGTQIFTKELNSWRYIDFNTKKPGFDDKRVRQAFAHAIDKDSIVNKLFNGIPKAWDSPWQPMDQYYNPNLEPYEYNPVKAAELLDEAGWKVGSDGIREKDGVKMKYEFSVTAGRAVDERVQQVVIAAMKELGIELTANNAAGSTLSAKYNTGDFDMKMAGWITSPSPSRTHFYTTLAYPPDGINHTLWANEEFTNLMVESDTELDFEKRKALVFKAQQIFHEELPELVLFNTTDIICATDKLQGYMPNSTNMTHFWHTSSWYFGE